MAISKLDKVREVFAGISAGDPGRATRYIDPQSFMQHNPYAADGSAGLREFIHQAPRDQLKLDVVRAIEDDAFVVTHAKGNRSGRNVFFDIFRFENDLVVEHWAFSAPDAEPNPSGHTQTDGPTEPKYLRDTAKNKALLRRYYETFHIRGDHSSSELYFSGEGMIRHEPGVRDGITEFLRDVNVLMQHRTIDEIKILLGQGDLVFIAAQGTHEGRPCVYLDLYRVENNRIVEHWGFPEMVPPQEQAKNSNGML